MPNIRKKMTWLGMGMVAMVIAAVMYTPIKASIFSSRTASSTVGEGDSSSPAIIPANPDRPLAVNDPTADARKTVAAAGLKNYRGSLPEWEGTFLVREHNTDALKTYLKGKINTDDFRAVEVHRIHAARSGQKWRFDQYWLDAKGQVISVYSSAWNGERHLRYVKNSSGASSALIESSPDTVITDQFEAIDELLIMPSLEVFDFNIAYYAGTTKLDGRNVECYARITDKYWQAVWLDPARGYAPVRNIGGRLATWTPYHYQYAEWRQDETGHWMPGRALISVNVPFQDKLGKTTEIAVLDFSRKVSPGTFDGYKLPKGTEVSDRIDSKDYVVDDESH